jgi:membrane protein implicated in regulation of membrane protease activity
MKAQRKRLQALLFSAIAIVAIVVLAAGLSGVRLQPGQPFPLSGFAQEGGGAGPQFGAQILFFLLRVFFLVIWVLTPLAIIYIIISPKARKRVLRELVAMLPFLMLLYLLMRAGPGLLSRGEQLEPASQALPTPVPASPAFEPVTAAPGWLVSALSLGLALLIVAPLVVAIWLLWRRRHRRTGRLERLAQEAEEAIAAIQAGADLRDAVIRCYVEMARVVREQRGIRRRSTMTAREFQVYLEEAGLPGEDVRRLTRLFENVRYGSKPTGPDEERQAVTALAAIVSACQGVA